MMSITGLIVIVIVIALLWWAVRMLDSAGTLPKPVVTILYVLLVVLFVLWLMQQFGLLSGGPVLRL